MKVLITSGGCKVPIDEVRHIGNFSSGRYGSELADEFLKNGHDVIFFSEKGSKEPKFFYTDMYHVPINPKIIKYKDYYEYLTVKEIITREQPDIIISAAAISDYVLDKTEGKISSENEELVIKLRKGEKVLQSFRDLAPKALIVGFKLLVGPTVDEKYKAIYKQLKHVDITVYNDLSKLRNGESGRELIFWAENNRIGSVKNMSVEDVVDEILAEAFVKEKLK
ncbi:MAG: hypothetical protein HQK53_13575 [Oligoflexia bacterium]|nr:hypothetical protein [Oligoflexia bacterium]